MADALDLLIARGPQQIDFSGITNIPNSFADGQKIAADYRTRQSLRGGIPRTADGQIDFAAAADMLARAGNTQGALEAARTAASASNTAFDRNIKTQELDLRRQSLAQKSGTLDQQVEQRRRAAAGLGLDQSHPAYNSYVLTGRMPREDQAPLTATDKKAILEADEAVLQSRAAIDALTKAAEISPQANSGYFASARASLGNNLPDWMVPDSVSSPQSSAATTNYDNLVLGQALASLKSIFGAAPTEGERKILIDLQASADKPNHVRQEILSRARGLAEKRLSFNEQRARELRGGTFYKPQSAQGAASGQPVRVSTQQEYNDLQPGTPYIAPDGSTRTKR